MTTTRMRRDSSSMCACHGRQSMCRMPSGGRCAQRLVLHTPTRPCTHPAHHFTPLHTTPAHHSASVCLPLLDPARLYRSMTPFTGCSPDHCDHTEEHQRLLCRDVRCATDARRGTTALCGRRARTRALFAALVPLLPAGSRLRGVCDVESRRRACNADRVCTPSLASMCAVRPLVLR
jgi:hypothetical protein